MLSLSDINSLSNSVTGWSHCNYDRQLQNDIEINNIDCNIITSIVAPSPTIL